MCVNHQLGLREKRSAIDAREPWPKGLLFEPFRRDLAPESSREPSIEGRFRRRVPEEPKEKGRVAVLIDERLPAR